MRVVRRDEVRRPAGRFRKIGNRAVRGLRNKRVENPWKKHDNIPL